MAAAHDYSDLHELIERLEPEQAEEVRVFTLRLVEPDSQFRVLHSFDGPHTNLASRARDVIRAEIGRDDADR